jgi:hypothetical protein
MSALLTNLNLKKLQSRLDWKLLLFLLLFLNVKLEIKIIAIVIIYLLQADFRFKFSFKNSRLPLFYPLIMVLAFADFIISKNYSSPNYILVLLMGAGFWLLCILAVHQVKLCVERNDVEVIHNTILVFFIINAAVSLLNFGAIIIETHALNPYTYQGQHQKYFIGTGDYIKGLTFDTSTTNAVLNAFGVVYFFTKKNAVMLLVCMAVVLLTGSNFTNIILLLVLALLFIFKSGRDQKSLIIICLGFLVVFMAKISPQNNDYVVETFSNIFHKPNPIINAPATVLHITLRPDSTLTPEEKKEKIATMYIDSLNAINYRLTQKHTPAAPQNKPVIKTDAGRILVPRPNINTEPYQSLTTTPPEQAQLVDFINTHKALLPVSGRPFHWSPVPGKVTAMQQTVNFFKTHPAKLIAGDGMGNFSSKLAFKASGLNISGGYPEKHTYINHDFLVNHLDLYLNFFSNRAGYHSLTNSPFSVYDQLFAEYGVLGFLLFCIYYLGFFTKHIKALTYGLPILLLTIAFLFIDYWFEQLSILVFFELLLLLDIKESNPKLKLIYGY